MSHTTLGALCPVCERRIELTKTNQLAIHSAPPAPGTRGSTWCDGSGKQAQSEDAS